MKKTLIFNGSPRKKGETMALIEELKQHLQGEVRTVDAYYADIKPCIDCRYCMKHPGCAVSDGMQELFSYISECDHIVLASPIYFEELSGQLLAVLSRLQMYFSARYVRGEEPVKKEKIGGILLTAGSFGPREKAESTAQMILRQMKTRSLQTVYVDRTDKRSVKACPEILEEVRKLAEQINAEPKGERKGVNMP